MFLDFIFKKNTKRKSLSVHTVENIKRDWKNIDVLLSQKRPSQLRQALIIADKSLDNALGDIVGESTMGERLKKSKDLFDKNLYNKIWEAHKIRNSLVHESGFEPPYFVVIKSVNNLKEALYTLGIKL
ncbi:hypothetical protein GYA37_03330 [candidate division WWE3 bacterium]|uniref:DUF86 domain-containing protein n=1 Tax=candidate division WWE3 bacterium TaxID=2053526 RepID=A0A7X9HSV3_UNCKA|nr:hypothetical protein [candidate division WWE3 bacterium]